MVDICPITGEVCMSDCWGTGYCQIYASTDRVSEGKEGTPLVHLKLPQTYTSTMTLKDAADRAFCASFFEGVKFATGSELDRNGWYIGKTVVTNADDFKAFNVLLQSLK